ncbi:head maturation protease, ClpP-related [Chachezhania antarctica]|uniref:head maturation protease, ClpP-related n=1 Tax=Chachezhania antarctica TaxID=2340860 RepID=UPI000EAE1B2C|nr:head maturation protease, ClpP-related [Chachezhania antarctica]|tara:strand:+ start:1383 stop:2246 length:864 start_codon:yes stop_codon:yes gene_type:complete
MTIRDLPKAKATSRPGVQSDISPKALQRWAPDVRAAAEDEPATISILEPIGADMWGDGVTARRISAALRSIGERPVTVNVNSPGGDYFEGLAIYNLLREHKQAVTINILGIAASAASVIAMAGDDVRIARAGFLMIHNVWILAAGDRHALREVADWLEPFDATAAEIYAARSIHDAKKIGEMLDRETWIGGTAAIEQGFADDYLPADMLETGGGEPSAALRAERKFDLLARRAGLSNAASRDILRDLKSGTPGAAEEPRPGAAGSERPGAAGVEQELMQLLQFAKSI